MLIQHIIGPFDQTHQALQYAVLTFRNPAESIHMEITPKKCIRISTGSLDSLHSAITKINEYFHITVQNNSMC
jgi:hypothetical protein